MSQKQYDRKRSLYFNLNYSCNNQCLFCASSTPLRDAQSLKAYILFNQFKAQLNKYLNYKIDSIVINGGEPTINRALPKILKYIGAKNIYVSLFTNGRRLASSEYAKALLSGWQGSISIPLYGRNAKTHDSFTKKAGSFNETIWGIENIIKIRKEYKLPLSFELKLLFIKPLLAENIKILEFIIEKFPTTDYISLNPLICSAPVQGNTSLIPSINQIKTSINMTLTHIRKKFRDYIDRISVTSFPRCLINKANQTYFKDRYSIFNHQPIYFDPAGSFKVRKTGEYSYGPACKECSLREVFSGIKTAECPFR